MYFICRLNFILTPWYPIFKCRILFSWIHESWYSQTLKQLLKFLQPNFSLTNRNIVKPDLSLGVCEKFPQKLKFLDPNIQARIRAFFIGQKVQNTFWEILVILPSPCSYLDLWANSETQSLQSNSHSFLSLICHDFTWNYLRQIVG